MEDEIGDPDHDRSGRPLRGFTRADDRLILSEGLLRYTDTELRDRRASGGG